MLIINSYAVRSVIQGLTGPSLASRVAAGAGLRGEAARRFAQDNRNLVTLTDDQQKRLLQVNLPSYEAIVRRGIHVYLTQNEFNALASFVYNPG